MHDGLEIDLVTHDIHKFFALMLKKRSVALSAMTKITSQSPLKPLMRRITWRPGDWHLASLR